jgi:hypothetical protein
MKSILGAVLILSTFLMSSCLFGPSVKKVMSYRHDSVYLTDRGHFRVGELPSSWKRMRVRAYAIAFHNREYGATIATDAFCGSAYEDLPLATLTSHLLAGVEDYKIESASEFTLDNRGALRTIANGSVDGVPLAFDVVVVKKNKCIIDFMCVAPVGNGHLAAADFEGFYGAFRYE